MFKHRTDKKHLAVSLVKSVFRILAGVALWPVCPLAGALLILAELLGVVEELVI